MTTPSASQAEPLEHLGSIDSLQTPAAANDRLNRHSNTTMVGARSSTSPSPVSNASGSQPQHYQAHNPSRDSASSLDQPNQVSPPIHQAIKRSAWNRFINSELGRTAFALLYFVVVCIFMTFCNQFSDHRWVETGYTKVFLEDRGFDIFPDTGDITPANIFVMTSVVFTLIGMALICPTWTARLIVIRRVFWVVGTLSVYRTLTLSVTTLPTPRKDCVPATDKGFGPMLWIALQMIPGTVEACTDDIFSGHTVFIDVVDSIDSFDIHSVGQDRGLTFNPTLTYPEPNIILLPVNLTTTSNRVTCAIQWRLYCRNKWVTYFSYIYITVGLCFVVATRLHYSVDVVLAIFITYAVWSLYMAMIDIVMEKEYFGIRRHHEKYAIFNDRWSKTNEQEQKYGQLLTESEESEKDPVSSHAASTGSRLAAKRAQLEYRMNRMRGPGIGYDRGEHDRVAFVPMQYNVWLTGLIRWCDGLDIRMRGSALGTSTSRWEELMIHSRTHSKDSGHPSHHTEENVTYSKAESNELDLEAGYPVMSQIGVHGREATTAPMMLDSIHVVSHTEQNPSAAGIQ
ncbi:hypothetical protein EDD11_000438 [Mortierella claussenii]|nr:hypothetical protein EDD11_000438 [Mortierella claussenii]